MSRKELTRALAHQDWDTVLQQGALLCNDCKLKDAARLATDSALFMLEHPQAGAISRDLARVILEHLP